MFLPPLPTCRRLLLALALVSAASLGGQPSQLFTRLAAVANMPILLDTAALAQPVTGRQGMVSSQEALATQAGIDVLREGGNAIDAAVTVAFTLAVTLPRAGNIGGGGFLLYHDATTGQTHALDFRERAPARATRDMFLGADGRPDPYLSIHTHLGAGVPGSVAGLAEALAKHGTIPLSRALAPAIRLAEDGMTVTDDLHNTLALAAPRLMRSAAARATFYPNGQPPPIGSTFRQPDLARTLKAIAEHGPDAFYRGPVAALIVSDMMAHGGIVSFDDLAAYRPVWREPVRGTFRGLEVVSMPPPSSGGVHLIQMLQMLEPVDLRSLGLNSAAYIQTVVEVSKRAFIDRAAFLGDPDFVPVPTQGLIHPEYAATRRASIPGDRVIPGPEVKPGDPWAFQPGGRPESAPRTDPPVRREGSHTTHFSVVDGAGNGVALTTTINHDYGNGHVVPGAGFFLNNEMDDFAAAVGASDAFGLLGGESNIIEPGKTMLSSMTPTLVFRDGQLHIVTGSMGGPRIITTVMQTILNIVEFQMNPAEALIQPRFHHQASPDVIRVERGFSADTLQILRQEGYRIDLNNASGSTHTIVVDRDGRLSGASDPRSPGVLTLGIH